MFSVIGNRRLNCEVFEIKKKNVGFPQRITGIDEGQSTVDWVLNDEEYIYGWMCKGREALSAIVKGPLS